MDSDRPFEVAAAGDVAGDYSRLEAYELGGAPTSIGAGSGVTAWLPCPHSRRVDSFAILIYMQLENGFPGRMHHETSLRLGKVKGKKKNISAIANEVPVQAEASRQEKDMHELEQD